MASLSGIHLTGIFRRISHFHLHPKATSGTLLNREPAWLEKKNPAVGQDFLIYSADLF
jgi:hypothetical protein